jgi:hypothetical protein
MDDSELLRIIHSDLRRFMATVQQDFTDLTTSVNNLIAADEAENTLLTSISNQLNAILANPTGVDPTAVTALRDQVNAELVKVNAAIGAASPPPASIPMFTIGGVVQGLAAGASLSLQDNAVDTLVINQNGPFAFPTPLPTGASYAATVSVPPSDGSNAAITSGTGTVASANVTSIVVTASAAAASPVATANLRKA